jgi:hypothetical protein
VLLLLLLILFFLLSKLGALCKGNTIFRQTGFVVAETGRAVASTFSTPTDTSGFWARMTLPAMSQLVCMRIVPNPLAIQKSMPPSGLSRAGFVCCRYCGRTSFFVNEKSYYKVQILFAGICICDCGHWINSIIFIFYASRHFCFLC